jgi:hypothetical protein
MRGLKHAANFFLLALQRRERTKVRVVILLKTLTPALILTPLQKIILEIKLCETDNKSLLVEDQPYPIPSRIWERLSRPVGERI